MSMEIFQKVREMGKEIKPKRKNEEINYKYMTAPCGLPCFECYLYLAQFDQEMGKRRSGWCFGQIFLRYLDFAVIPVLTYMFRLKKR